MRMAALTLSLLALVALLFSIFSKWARTRSRWVVLPDLVLFFPLLIDLTVLMSLHQCLNNAYAVPADLHKATALPLAAHLLLSAAALLWASFGILREIRIGKTSITPGSIREAADNLPSGLCICHMNGLPVLINRKMTELSRVLTGRDLLSGELFWKELEGFTDQRGIRKTAHGDELIFILPDESVWQFSRTETMADGSIYVQTVAAEITDIYRLTEELAQQNEVLDGQHRRLKKLKEDIIQITQEEEVLASKVSIHDELGRCVLASRLALAQEQPAEALDTVAVMWMQTAERLATIAQDAQQAGDNTLSQLTSAAAALGCAIDLDGKLPENGDTAYLLLTAVREAVTNAVRHAGADRVMVRLREEGDTLTAVITDNGTAQAVSVTEGGGLGSLRRKVEQAGGEMEIKCEAGVSLHLRLRLCGKEDWE